MKCIILAGGFATRLWPLTEKTAKPLILLAGKPLISWIVESLPEDLNIIVSTNAVFSEDFETWRKANFPKRKIEIFIEDSKSEEGKKGALFATALVIEEKNITEDVLLIAGDNYFGFSLQEFITHFESNPNDALLAAYDIGDIERAKSFGVVVPASEERGVSSGEQEEKNKTPSSQLPASSFIKSFQEKPKHPLSTLVSTGCFAFPEHLLSAIIDFAQQNKDD